MDNFDLKKYLAEGKLLKESSDHVDPMVAKAYREYIKAKKDSDNDVDFAEDPGKAYRYYTKKLNNTYSTLNDRREIESILKKKYGGINEESDVVTKMTDFGPIDVPNTKKYIKKSPEEMTMRELEKKIEQLENSKFSNENARELMALRSEYSYRTHFKNESLNEGFEKSAIQKALKNNGYDLKQKDFKVSSKKSNIKGNITHYYLNGEEIGNSEYNYDEFISKATKRIKENPKKYNLDNSKSINEIKGFKEFKETGFKLGDKVEFMGSAHPTHIKPIKLTGVIEYFEPANEIGVRVDGYGKFIPFFEIQSNIEIIN